MEHVAIDLGGRESQICVRAADGQIVDERRWPTGELRAYLEKRPESRVVVETCAEAFAVADVALELGHEVRVVPATLVRSLGVGSRRTKTDRRDAQILSEVSCRIDLPSVHIPTTESRGRKSLCRLRDNLVTARTKIGNGIRGWSRTVGKKIPAGPIETLAERVRMVDWAESLPSYVVRQLETLKYLTEQINEADEEITAIAKADPVCKKLMTVPGVGPVTSVAYVATLDQVERFPDARKAEAYLGLVPGEDSSSDKVRRTGITKAGSSSLRRLLVQAAWAARRKKGLHPMVDWSLNVEKRRGKRVAIVGLARKIAGILYAIWRDGTEYRARKAAAPIPVPTPAVGQELERFLEAVPLAAIKKRGVRNSGQRGTKQPN